MILLLDNFDSFTFNLVDYFNQFQVECVVYRNNAPFSKIVKDNYSGIVLSPGPLTPYQAGCMMEVIDFYHDKLPILGICLGHQAICQYFGATLEKAIRPMHGKVSSIHLTDDYIFSGMGPLIKAVRYHSLIIKKVSEELAITAYTSEREIMAIKHNKLAIRGLQFHPEAELTTTGLKMIENWILFNNIA